jgi:hypothetical protein
MRLLRPDAILGPNILSPPVARNEHISARSGVRSDVQISVARARGGDVKGRDATARGDETALKLIRGHAYCPRIITRTGTSHDSSDAPTWPT